MGPGSGDLISGREAARELAEIGLTRRQSCRVLAAGLAGAPIRTSSAVLYERHRVRELADRPVAGSTQVAEACPSGVFIARRDVDASRSEAERRAALQPAWAFSPLTAVLIRAKVEQDGSLPLVATVSGFVTTGADLMGATRGPEGYVLDLRPPGPWFDPLRQCRVPSGPGREWLVRGWHPRGHATRQWGTMAS